MRQGQALNGVVFVHKHGQGIDRDLDWRRLIAKLFLKRVDLFRLHRAAHRAELCRAFDQRRRSCGGAFAFDLDIDVRVHRPKAFGPQSHQVVERIGANTVEIARYTTDTLVRPQLRIDLHLGLNHSLGAQSE